MPGPRYPEAMKFPILGTLAAATLLTLTACHAPADAGAMQNSSPAQVSLPTATAATGTGRTTPSAGSDTDPASGLRWTSVSALPKQGQQTYRLIVSGGPFPYARDGVVFQNREGLLPRRSRGSYLEYTVNTPGSSDRGARRIVCAAQAQPNGPQCYYTGDHYASFQSIRP